MVWRRAFLLILLLPIILAACSGSASPTAADPDLLFEDSFDGVSSGNWRTEADESGRTAMVDGLMIVEINSPNILQYTALGDEKFSDFDLEVDATFLSSSLGSTLGILLRMVSPDDFVRFEIMADGRYMIERFNPDGSWVRYLDDWESNPVLITGYGAANHLRILADGPEIAFFANDELLYTLQNAPVAAGQIALDAGTFGESGTRAAFDNLTIRNP